MKDKPSSTVPTPASVVEFKDGTVQAQYRLDGQPIQSVSPSNRPSGLRQLLLSAFMPEGWPNAVTPDYTGFVAWNTVQAISSYVRGVLSSHAVFKGIGVGSQAATALGAVFQFFIRDILGMAGGIIFAYAAGSNFDSNAKQWRLFADIMNDIAMALDLASPLVPGCFMLLASLGNVSRAMVGMSAGATGAALTQHFAAGSNAADISAKADSRERATSIIGSLLGMAVTQHLADNVAAAWLFFVVLTVVHIWANMRALRCLVLSSLNQPRLRLLLQHYMQQEKVYSPEQMSGLESLMVPPLAAVRDYVNGNCPVTFGARITTAIAAAAPAPPDSSSSSKRKEQGLQAGQLQQLLGQQPPASNRHYMLFVTGRRRQRVQVVLHHGVSQEVQLRAYLHATHLAMTLNTVKPGAEPAQLLSRSQAWVEQRLPTFLSLLQRQGWQLDKLYLPRPEWTAQW